MDKITYEPIVDYLPNLYTIEDLRNVYFKLRPLFADEEREVKIIQIQDE